MVKRIYQCEECNKQHSTPSKAYRCERSHIQSISQEKAKELKHICQELSKVCLSLSKTKSKKYKKQFQQRANTLAGLSKAYGVIEEDLK